MMRQLLLAAAAVTGAWVLSGCATESEAKRPVTPGPVVTERVPADNPSSHDAAFFRKLLTNRMVVYEPQPVVRDWNPALRMGPVRGRVYRDGHSIVCRAKGLRDTRGGWARGRWHVDPHPAARTIYQGYSVKNGPTGRAFVPFYDSGTGEFRLERYHKGEWVVAYRGWIQKSWPRVLAEACPRLKPGLPINEKQTGNTLGKLRAQGPEAPLRGLGEAKRSGPGTPAMTREEAWAFLQSQAGYIVTSASGRGHVFVPGDGGRSHEVWVLGDDGSISAVGRLREEGGRMFVEAPDRPGRRHPAPVLATGHRHPAFQLTGGLVAVPKPTALPFMGAAYADKRFVFHPQGEFSVVDEAGSLVSGPHFAGVWRWTRGRLEMAVRDDPVGPRGIGWRELARQLGKTPAVWKRTLQGTG